MKWPRKRLPLGTGAGKRTLFKPQLMPIRVPRTWNAAGMRPTVLVLRVCWRPRLYDPIAARPHPLTPSPTMASLEPIAAPLDGPAPPAAEVLVLVAHPEIEQSRANRRLLQTARALQSSLPDGRLQVRDLYQLYPDFSSASSSPSGSDKSSAGTATLWP